ncbi:hypothetical protein QWY28_18350 [Nocardioides sp. SOB77]|uniref:Peptidase n=1 Tax=Nocardioides oceani TaxID=3058369 RepID=A0ABT8FKD9_9ACTN|nr:hypothetical protein [Nocardioides oceani]MDN4174930.1 hypothetical protein [Nocardioides oceani]
MYNTPGAAATGGGTGLAMTGLTGAPIWVFLAGFALLALSLAILRIVPRSER